MKTFSTISIGLGLTLVTSCALPSPQPAPPPAVSPGFHGYPQPISCTSEPCSSASSNSGAQLSVNPDRSVWEDSERQSKVNALINAMRDNKGLEAEASLAEKNTRRPSGCSGAHSLSEGP